MKMVFHLTSGKALVVHADPDPNNFSKEAVCGEFYDQTNQCKFDTIRINDTIVFKNNLAAIVFED